MTVARLAFAAFLIMLLTAQRCSSDTTASTTNSTITGANTGTKTGPILPSEWGGLHMGMVVLAGGATIEYDCATGTIDEPLTVDASGRFDVRGTHSRGHGGPVLIGETPERRPARYSGSTDGNSMTLSVTLTESGQVLGPFTLARGASPAVLKCV